MTFIIIIIETVLSNNVTVCKNSLCLSITWIAFLYSKYGNIVVLYSNHNAIWQSLIWSTTPQWCTARNNFIMEWSSIQGFLFSQNPHDTSTTGLTKFMFQLCLQNNYQCKPHLKSLKHMAICTNKWKTRTIQVIQLYPQKLRELSTESNLYSHLENCKTSKKMNWIIHFFLQHLLQTCFALIGSQL